MTHERSVLVVGARGALGSLLVSSFADAGWRVLRGARGVDHPDGRHVDVSDRASVSAAVFEADLVVNTVPDEDLVVERCVIEEGGAVLNVSALPAEPGYELRWLNPPADGVVVLHAGLAPGITNLAAAELLDRFPEADALELAFTVSAASTGGAAGGDFLHRNLTQVDRHETAWIPLPAPFGARTCVGFGETDEAWFGFTAAVRDVDVRSYLCLVEPEANDALVTANAGPGLGRVPRSAFGAGRGPTAAGPSREPVAHWVAALRDDERLGAMTAETRGDYAGAAAGTLVLAETLASAGVAPGIYGCEEVFALDDVRPRLHERGIAVVDRSPVGGAVQPAAA